MREAIIALLTIAATAPATAQQQWFIGHLGEEQCVPLNDIGRNFERVYHGAGQMQTPEDLATHFREGGGRVPTFADKDYDAGARMLVYQIDIGGTKTFTPLFNDAGLCKSAMDQLKQ